MKWACFAFVVLSVIGAFAALSCVSESDDDDAGDDAVGDDSAGDDADDTAGDDDADDTASDDDADDDADDDTTMDDDADDDTYSGPPTYSNDHDPTWDCYICHATNFNGSPGEPHGGTYAAPDDCVGCHAEGDWVSSHPGPGGHNGAFNCLNCHEDQHGKTWQDREQCKICHEV